VLETLFEEIELDAKKKQARLSAVLDSIGPPGMAAWDPIKGFVELRGKQFRAQMLGSFDGRSWLWSWANTYLEIPEELTAYARRMRDQPGPLSAALATPMIEDDDEELPYMLGSIAIAHGFGEAFYYANQSQIYLLDPGQLEDVEAAAPAGPQRYATCFSHTRRSLADVVTHLRGDKNLKQLDLVQLDDDHATLTGTGYSLSIRRRDRLRDVIAEVKALPSQQETARGAATAFIVEGTLDLERYNETLYTATMGAWAPASHFGGRGLVPWQALSVCERLNQLDRMAVHDSVLRTFYPRS